MACSLWLKIPEDLSKLRVRNYARILVYFSLKLSEKNFNLVNFNPIVLSFTLSTPPI